MVDFDLGSAIVDLHLTIVDQFENHNSPILAVVDHYSPRHYHRSSCFVVVVVLVCLVVLAVDMVHYFDHYLTIVDCPGLQTLVWLESVAEVELASLEEGHMEVHKLVDEVATVAIRYLRANRTTYGLH